MLVKSRVPALSITQRKQTEAGLSASEERLKLATALSQVGIWEYNIQTDEHIWDDTMFALYGIRREDFSGAYDAWATHLHPEDRAATETALQDAIDGKREYQAEFRVIWPNGEVHYIKGHAQVIRDAAGNPVRMIGINWDNGANARTQQQLQLAHAAINKGRNAFFWISPKGQVINVNDYACQNLGYARGELIGCNISYFDPDFPSESWPMSWAAIKEKKVRTIERRHRRKDGTVFPVEIITNYIAFNGEEYCFAFALDITERKLNEQALRESEEKFRAITDNAKTVIFMKDLAGRYLHVNREYEELFHVSNSAIQGKTGYDIFPREVTDAFIKNDQTVIQSGQPYEAEELVPHDNGVIHTYLCVKFPMWNADGQIYAVCGIATDITERKQAEENLKNSLNLLRSVIDTSPVRVFWKDRDSRFLGCNSLFAKDAGFDRPDELIGKTDFEMAWMDQAELYRADDRMVMQSDTVKLSYDEPQTTPDGRQIWLRTSRVPLRNESNGEIIGVLGIYEDITERKLAENALRRHKVVIDTARDGFWVVDLEGNLLEVNQAYSNMSGYSVDELVHMHVSQLEAIESPQETRAHIDKVVAQGADLFETVHRCKDGALIDVKVSVNFLAESQLFFAFFRDITERKRTEEFKRYRTLLQNTSDAILVADMNGNFEEINHSGELLFGYTREEICRINVSQIHPSHELPKVRQHFEDMSEKGTFEPIETQIVRKDGRVVDVEVRPTLVEIGGRKVAQGIFIDRTEQKHLEQERLAREQAQRDVLVREVHHRIKNNLQGITGILRQFEQKHPEVTGVLEEVIGQVNSVAVIHDLLGKTSSAEVRLCELVSAIAAGVESIWKKPIAVDIPTPWTPCRIAESESEAVPLALVLNELISNAVKHGDTDGHVSITIRHEPRPDTIRLTIRNTGSISPKLESGDNTGFDTGLQLTSALLPREGARLSWVQDGTIVTTVLELDKPVISLET